MKKKLTILWHKLKSILSLKETPHSIALGAAIGMFWNFIPTIGIGFLISTGTAKLFKASPIAALTINLGTGFFIPLFYSLNLLMGRFLLHQNVSPEEVGDTLQQSLLESLDGVEEVAEEPVRYFLLDKLQSISGEFIMGCIVNSFLAAAIIYFILLALLNYRQYQKEKF